MAALVFTPGTVFVLAVLAVLSVLAVRRIRSRGLCDSGPALSSQIVIHSRSPSRP